MSTTVARGGNAPQGQNTTGPRSGGGSITEAIPNVLNASKLLKLDSEGVFREFRLHAISGCQ